MNSKSGRKLSLEELKQLNRSQSQVPPKPPAEPARQDRENLLAVLTALYRLESTNSSRLERLEAGVSAQEALFRALSRQVGQLPTQSQLEALARDVAQMRAELKQAGKKKELSVSPPSLETTLSVLIWLALILLGTLVGMVVLRTIWSGLGRTLERGADADPVRDATTTHQHGDRKALRREREKKIALGHKEDDHEEEPTWQQTMS